MLPGTPSISREEITIIVQRLQMGVSVLFPDQPVAHPGTSGKHCPSLGQRLLMPTWLSEPADHPRRLPPALIFYDGVPKLWVLMPDDLR